MRKYNVVYVGAPYGLNEFGEIISSHNTVAGALKSYDINGLFGKNYNNLKIKDASGKILDLAELRGY